MAIHHLTPPIRGGERPRLLSTLAEGVLRLRRETLHNMQTFGLGGPVTQAIRAMRADDPNLDRERIRDLRRRIAERIEADIALLDALNGDTDFEYDDELEAENEHGGDVQDELHDAQFDDEHAAQPVFMGGGAFHVDSIGRGA